MTERMKRLNKQVDEETDQIMRALRDYIHAQIYSLQVPSSVVAAATVKETEDQLYAVIKGTLLTLRA